MIERDFTLPDGRTLKYHQYAEPVVDFVNKKIYLLTRSYEDDNLAEPTVLRAKIAFDVWDQSLLADPDAILTTSELKLYVGEEPDIIETPDTLKNDKKKEINKQRDLLEKAGFPYMGKVIDSDMQSVNRINTTFSAAMACFILGQPFSVEWTCADNSPLILDAEGMIGMPQALAAYGSSLHYRATDLKAMVDTITSTDIEEVKALIAAIPDS